MWVYFIVKHINIIRPSKTRMSLLHYTNTTVLHNTATQMYQCCTTQQHKCISVSQHSDTNIPVLCNTATQIKWVPENLYTFTKWTAIEKVYIFSGTHFRDTTYSVWSFFAWKQRSGGVLSRLSLSRWINSRFGVPVKFGKTFSPRGLPSILKKRWKWVFDIEWI